MSERETKARAERLRVALYVMSHKDSGPDHPIDASAADWSLLDGLTEEDRALADACYAVEAAMEDEPTRRAERLRVLLSLRRGSPYVARDEGLDDVPDEDFALLRDLAPEDTDLADECLALEAEVRERAFYFASRLTALVAAGEGGLDERIRDLEWGDYLDAVGWVVALGWIDR